MFSVIGTIQNNSAGNGGGGFHIDGPTAITMSDFDFLSNTASGTPGGGALAVFNCVIMLTVCDFIGIAVLNWGGGLFSFQFETELTIANFFGYPLGVGGGGLFRQENKDLSKGLLI